MKELSINEELIYKNNRIGLFNYSHYFLLPLFGIKVNSNEKYQYLNSYIGDNFRKSSIENSLYLLYRVKDYEDVSFLLLTKKMSSIKGYLYSYYVGLHDNINCIMFVFKTEDSLNYNNIINGNYSKCTIPYVNKLLSYGFDIKQTKILSDVLLKSKMLKATLELELNTPIDNDAELFDKFNPSFEIFRNA